MTDQGNLFRLPKPPWENEIFETLHQGGAVRIERILSRGHTTPAGNWYDQESDEWVALLQGEAQITFADRSTRRLRAGEWLFIAAHRRHRVSYTSTEPPCVWLAVHLPGRPE